MKNDVEFKQVRELPLDDEKKAPTVKVVRLETIFYEDGGNSRTKVEILSRVGNTVLVKRSRYDAITATGARIRPTFEVQTVRTEDNREYIEPGFVNDDDFNGPYYNETKAYQWFDRVVEGNRKNRKELDKQADWNRMLTDVNTWYRENTQYAKERQNELISELKTLAGSGDTRLWDKKRVKDICQELSAINEFYHHCKARF